MQVQMPTSGNLSETSVYWELQTCTNSCYLNLSH